MLLCAQTLKRVKQKGDFWTSDLQFCNQMINRKHFGTLICSGQVRPRQGTEICNFGAPSPLEALHWMFCFFSSIYVQFSKTSPLKSGESSEKSSGEKIASNPVTSVAVMVFSALIFTDFPDCPRDFLRLHGQRFKTFISCYRTPGPQKGLRGFLKTLTSLNKKSRQFCPGDNSIWSLPSASSTSVPELSGFGSWSYQCQNCQDLAPGIIGVRIVKLWLLEVPSQQEKIHAHSFVLGPAL